MKNKNKTIIHKFAAIIAVIVVIGILLVYTAFFGNPISASAADKVIKQYVKETYPLLGLQVQRAHYNYISGEYMSMVQSENSIDTKFTVYSSDGKIVRDNYENFVLNMFNTQQRLSREYSSLIKTLVAEEPGLENNTSIVRYEEDTKDILKLDMEFDRSLPLKAEVTIRYKLTDDSTGSIAKVLGDAHKVFINNGCNFDKYGLFAENNEMYISVHDVTTADIEGGELAKLLENAKNSDSLGGIRFVIKKL